jgi:hypothetical protein
MVMDNLKEIMTMLFVEQPGYTITIKLPFNRPGRTLCHR